MTGITWCIIENPLLFGYIVVGAFAITILVWLVGMKVVNWFVLQEERNRKVDFMLEWYEENHANTPTEALRRMKRRD